MRITTTRNTKITSSRPRKAGGSGKFVVAGFEEPGRRTPSESAAPVHTVSGLLALQEVGQESSKQRAIANGRAQLDLLDDLKLGLLAGRLPAGSLTRLAQTVEARRGFGGEPGLRDLLDHIALRARVELAKLGISPGAGAKPR